MKKQPVFIVGLYKCGTTWLSYIFEHHPAFRSTEEIDIIKSCFNTVDNKFEPKSKANQLACIFGSNTWCPIPNFQYHDKTFFNGDPQNFIHTLEELSQKKFGTNQNTYRFQEFFDFDKNQAIDLFKELQKSTDAKSMIQQFVHANQTIAGDKRIVLKAADQIERIDMLFQIYPDAPKIFIVRDGRDASISALKFKKLMKAMNAPWLKNADINYFDLLRGWANRADKAYDLWKQNKIHLIRYEDLKEDFCNTMKGVFEYAGAPTDQKVLDHIYTETTFEKMSGGRKPGEEATSVFRKGTAGEWLDTLDQEEIEKAWEIAGKTLSKFSYQKHSTQRIELN